MNVPDTLRAAAHALSDRTDLAHGPALAGLLHNRADDMERNVAVWQRTGQDVAALIEKYYGVYLTPFSSIHVTAMIVPHRLQNELKGNPALQRRK
jgi:hypothetical protein